MSGLPDLLAAGLVRSFFLYLGEPTSRLAMILLPGVPDSYVLKILELRTAAKYPGREGLI